MLVADKVHHRIVAPHAIHNHVGQGESVITPEKGRIENGYDERLCAQLHEPPPILTSYPLGKSVRKGRPRIFCVLCLGIISDIVGPQSKES
jgi:hypothetical protein